MTEALPDRPANARERLPTLDLLRFVAAAMVLVFHYTFRGAVHGAFVAPTFPELDGLTRYGSFGVNLFFIISGFVILLTVDAGGGRPGHFAASRISRLYPAFWAAVTLTFAVTVVTGASFAVGISDFVRNLGMFPSWIRGAYIDGAYWTLEIELTFYLLMLVYLIFLRRRLKIEWLLLAWLIVTLPLAPNDLGPGRLRLGLMVDAAPFFIAGCVCYLVWRGGWTRLRAGLFAAAWIDVWVVAARNAVDSQAEFGTPFSPLIAGAIASIGFVVFLVLVTRPEWFRFGGSRATALGALTYPLYLVHQNVGYVVINAVAPIAGRWVALGAAIVVVVTIAIAIHRLVERPLNRRFRRWLEPRLGALDRLAAAPLDGVARRLRGEIPS
ncbi:MAG TPA: acyltransferase [Candidatus Limnocylindrales bacterium]|nr:acyltransferase [Candidatus Limnocylindrales bacterium]